MIHVPSIISTKKVCAVMGLLARIETAWQEKLGM